MAPQIESLTKPPESQSTDELEKSVPKRKRPMLSLIGVSCTVLVLSVLVPSEYFRLPLPRLTARESTWFLPRRPRARLYSHVIPPENGAALLSNVTLRDFIVHPDGIHLALAPAFFGFFAQFGALEAWEEVQPDVLHTQIKCLAGASAGAMSAVLLSSGISPTVAAKFCESVTLDKFADPPGMLAIFKGNLFHDIMRDFMRETVPGHSLQLQDGKIPVAVTAFDLKSMTGKILTRGSMPLAARASACFPLLFQPVSWQDNDDSCLFIDGGLGDMWGLEGLAAFPSDKPKRVVHIAVGDYDGSLGPSNMPEGVEVSEVVSISIRNTPQPHPWNMANGPLAVAASRRGMLASLDLPLYRGEQLGHYVLHIDATEFIPEK